MQKSTEFELEVLPEIQNRRSRRAYSSTPLESEKIQSLFEAARWAPSSLNEQPWTYIYATKDQPELWNKLLSVLNEGNITWASDAPLLVLSLYRKNLLRNNQPNGSAKYDLGGANAFLSLQATSLGLNVHQMGGYNRQKAKDVLNIKNHGLSLAVAAELEWDLLISHEDDTLHDYYEQRMVGFAPMGDTLYCVVFVEREADLIRIISLRAAERYEVKRYAANYS